MKPKMMLKMGIDLVMTVLLLCQMAYMLVGETVHEYLGTAMFVLFILHHLLNRTGTAALKREDTAPCGFCRPPSTPWCCCVCSA